ncbi:MAG: deoxyhypusine synthase family protein, partial [Planctomycetales bacterium]|nr:deoxyhypusine synthase family protein [Planctomycetales bacterium]
SREIIQKMGEHLETNAKTDSIIQAAYQCGVPIFCPAFSDCSAGLGIVAHYHERLKAGRGTTAFDSAKDFYELTQIKLNNPVTGLLMIGGGVPKNFAQDIVVSADILTAQDGGDAPQMHKYAIQITVADTRDGALSGSTLKEASSWGKVDTTYEQMVFSEATIAVPLIAGYAYHKRGWEQRQEKQFARIYTEAVQAVG